MIGAVKDQVIVCENVQRLLRDQVVAMGNVIDIGVQSILIYLACNAWGVARARRRGKEADAPGEIFHGAVDLAAADADARMGNLAVQVGQLDRVSIDQAQGAYAGACQV